MSESEDELDDIRDEKREKLTAETRTADEPIHVEGDDHLQQLVDDNDIVLVDFYADWCGPCKMLEPTVEQLADETDAIVAKVDIDQYQAIAQDYRVQGVPTLYLFADGEAVEQMVGVQDKATLESKIDAAGA